MEWTRKSEFELHPAGDPKLWTARMQDAWNDVRAALARAQEVNRG